MAKKVKRRVESAKQDDTKLFAFLATFLSIIGFIIALVAKKDDKYVMFYAKQSLVVFIASIVLSVIAAIFHPIIFIGQIVYIATTVVNVVLWVLSWVYALSGEMRYVPIVGRYADRVNL